MAGIKQGEVLDGYRFLGGNPSDARSWESTRIARGTIDSGFIYMGGDPADKGNWEEAGGLVRRALGDTAVSAVKSAITVPETMVGVADLLTGGNAGKAAESLGFRPKEARAALDEMLTPEQRLANRKVQEADGFIDTAKAALSNPSTIFHTAVESAGSLLPAGAVARGAMAIAPRIGGAVAAGIGEGVVSAGQTAEQVRQETQDGLLTGSQAGIAAASGALTGAIGAVAGRIANRLGIGDIDQLVAGVQQAGPKAQKSFARALMEGFATEGVLQELPQSAQEQIAQNIALNRPWDEGVGNAAATGALAGGIMGVGAAPFSHASKRLATATNVPDMIEAATEMVNAPLDFPVGDAAKDLLPKQSEPELSAELGAAPPVAVDPGVIDYVDPSKRTVDEMASGLQLAPQQSLPWTPAPAVPAETAQAIATADEVVPPVNRAPRQRTDAVELAPVPAQPVDPVLDYVDKLRQVNTPQARAFVQDFNAGRITRRDVIRVMQSQGQDPLTPDQRIEQAASQAPAPAQGIQPAPVYRSRSAAFVQARKVGGEVVPVEGGFSVKEVANAGPDVAGSGGRGISDLGAARGTVGMVQGAGEPVAAGQPVRGDVPRVDAVDAGRGRDGALKARDLMGEIEAAGVGTRDAKRKAMLGHTQEELRRALVSPNINRKDQAENVSRLEERIGALTGIEQAAIEADQRDQVQSASRSMLKGARQEMDAAVAGGAMSTDQARAVASRAGATGNAAEAAQTVFNAVDAAAHEAATSPKNNLPEPTEAQKEAGNYPKGHARIAGLDIAIENPQGSVRRGVDPNGKAWENTLQHHYGYIKGTVGADKDHVDAFIKPGTAPDFAGQVFVVDQVDPATGRFDEHKALIGFGTEQEARDAYQSNYAKGWKGLQSITPMGVDEFKAWVSDPANTRKPLTKPQAKPARDDALIELRKRESVLKSLKECLG